MQATWISHLLSRIEKVRGWGRFEALLDRAYLLYYRVRGQSPKDILKRKHARKSGIIIILCKGNVCRSAFLGEYLKKTVHPSLPLRFVSAGLRTRDGSLSPEIALSCAAEYGIDLSSHRGNHPKTKQIKDADLVVGMEPLHHLEFYFRFFTWRNKFLLLRAMENKPQSLTISDPLFRSRSDFKDCFELLLKDGNLLVAALKELIAEEAS